MRQYAACLYIGKANREFYESHGVRPSRLFPAPYCVENERFSDCSARWRGRKAELRKRLGIPTASVCFLFSGKLIPKKHPLELLQAFENVVLQGAPAHLLVVGDGQLRLQCEQYVREHRLSVTFAGFVNQSQIAEWYAAADCLVLPSDSGETWGLVVNEAMACGCPALVSDQVGCAVDLIVEQETGRTFRFGDWRQLADRMLELAHAPFLLRSMGEAARRHIAAYSPQAAAEGIVRAVHAVGGSRAGG